MAYTLLKPGQAPTLNTSGDAVRALQAQLNTQNAGQAGYTPLKVDGLYGPLTAAAAAYKAPAPTPTPTPTIGQAYNLPAPQVNPELEAARTASDKFYQNEASGTPNVDEAKIRSDTLAQFQAEIDSTNALFANKLKEAKALGEGRIGTATAVQGRHGLLGSDFGNAAIDDVNNANADTYSGIDADRAAAVNSILSAARKEANQAIIDKTAAIKGGYDSHVKYLEDAAQRRETKATKAAQFIYSQKLSPDKLSPDELSKTAAGYGVTAEEIKNAYIDVKKTGDIEQAKKDAENAKLQKEAQTILPAGSVVIDPTGKVIAQGTDKTEKVSPGQEVYKKNADGTYTKVVTGTPKPVVPKKVTPKSKSTYTSFSAKPTAASISKVNAYITAHGGNQAALDAANGDETSFYKVLNAANAEKTSSSASSLPVAP